MEKGAKKNSADPLTAEEEEQLWATGQLGDHCPEVLLRTVWYLNTMHFGWRGVDEHRVLYGDFHLGTDKILSLWSFKTQNGSEGQQDRVFNPRMYATGTTHCRVFMFKKYYSLHPPQACTPESPFYLQKANNPKEDIWYKNQPVGICKIHETNG